MSLVTSLGARYCDEYMRNGIVAHDNKAHYIERISSENILIRPVGGGETVALPPEWLTGFAKLAYPELGYRKVGDYAVYVHRRQSAYRGLRNNLLHHDMTPASYMLHLARNQGSSRRASDNMAFTTAALVEQVMCPVYDGREVLDRVLSGTVAAFVPNSELCIEPLYNSDKFGIYHSTKLAGTISSGRVIDTVSNSIRKAVENFL